MNRLLTILVLCWCWTIGKSQVDDVIKISIQTSLGEIDVDLYPKKAPVTVQNFLRYVDKHMYDSAFFYRVVRMNNQPNNDVNIEVIQGGIRNPKLEKFLAIAHETTEVTGIRHSDGAISMARNAPGSTTSEFFICIGEQPSLDFQGLRNPDLQGFSAFGLVTKGMDVVRNIQVQSDKKQMLIEPVLITSIIRR